MHIHKAQKQRGAGACLSLAALLFSAIMSIAQAPPVTAPPQSFAALTPTPPIGWNSWDSYGLTINEEQFRANTRVQAKELLPFGFRYAILDEGWYIDNPLDRSAPEKLRYAIDPYGRFQPVPARFPSSVATGGDAQSVTSLRALGGFVHGLGLQFGIHIIRGIPKESVAKNMPIQGSRFHATDAADQADSCPWDPTSWGIRENPAGQAWYDSLMRQYADWGVDYIKVDCIASHPYKSGEIRMIRAAIDRTERPMVLSLSPGPAALNNAAELGELAQMWRISNDIWDVWQTHDDFPISVRDQFAAAAAWAPYAKPGNWPDADMLPFGWLGPHPGEGSARRTRLTLDEQRTQLTLWSIMRSPLILGANLTALDPVTLALVTNRDVLELDQHSRENRQTEHTGDLVVWRATDPSAAEYLALFNLGEKPMRVQRPLTGFGLQQRPYSQRNLWSQGGSTRSASLAAVIQPHAVLLLRLQ